MEMRYDVPEPRVETRPDIDASHQAALHARRISDHQRQHKWQHAKLDGLQHCKEISEF